LPEIDDGLEHGQPMLLKLGEHQRRVERHKHNVTQLENEIEKIALTVIITCSFLRIRNWRFCSYRAVIP
jgi:hypothetical protein